MFLYDIGGETDVKLIVPFVSHLKSTHGVLIRPTTIMLTYPPLVAIAFICA